MDRSDLRRGTLTLLLVALALPLAALEAGCTGPRLAAGACGAKVAAICDHAA